jgi:hypothetical protein
VRFSATILDYDHYYTTSRGSYIEGAPPSPRLPHIERCHLGQGDRLDRWADAEAADGVRYGTTSRGHHFGDAYGAHPALAGAHAAAQEGLGLVRA